MRDGFSFTVSFLANKIAGFFPQYDIQEGQQYTCHILESYTCLHTDSSKKEKKDISF